MYKTVEQQMKVILADYSKDVITASNEVFNNVAKGTVQKLKNESPKKSGEYARSWTKKTERGGALKTDTIIVYNKKHQLTHLLEKGHVVRNAKGTYGRARAFPHIAPAEDWAADELESAIKRKL